jgi:hypothetical protein
VSVCAIETSLRNLPSGCTGRLVVSSECKTFFILQMIFKMEIIQIVMTIAGLLKTGAQGKGHGRACPW